jgi:hypothetical protein
VGLKESGDYGLERGDFFAGPFLLSVRCRWLPLEGEDVKHFTGFGGLRLCRPRELKGQYCRAKGGTAIPEKRTAGCGRHFGFPFLPASENDCTLQPRRLACATAVPIND